MNTLQIFCSITAALASIAAIVGLIVTIKRNVTTDSTAGGKESGMILTEIGYIKSSVDDVKSNQKEQDRLHRELIEKVGRIDESVKSAHHRIDGIENRIQP